MGILAEAFADARLDTKTFDKDVKAWLAKLEAVAKQAEKALNVRADVNTQNATKAVTALQRQVAGVEDVIDIKADADTKKAVAAIKALDQQLSLLDEHLNVSADADTSGVTAQLTLLDEAVGRLDGRTINIDVDTNAAAAVAEITALDAAVAKTDDTMTKAGGRGGRGALMLAIGLGAVGAAAVVAGGALGAFGVVTAATFEQVSVGFQGTLGDAEKAASFLGELEQFAARTPFEFDQLTSSAQRLLGTFGKQFQTELLPTLSIIGDVASSLGVSAEGIDRVTLALGQIKGKGRVMAQELQQISEALPGFSAIKVIAAELGLSVPQAFKQIELGAVDADVGIEAILEGMRKFPGAAGAMEKQSQTLIGRLSTLRDNLKITAREGFEPLFQSVKGVVDDAITPLTEAITVIAPAVNTAFRDIGPALFPFLAQLSEGFAAVLEGVGPGLAQLFRGLTPALVPLGEVLGRIGEVVGATGSALATALVPALEALAFVLNSIPVPVLSALVVGLIGLKAATAAATAIDALSKSMNTLGRAGIGPVALGLTAIAAVVVGVTAAFQSSAAEQRRLQQVADETADSLLRLTDAFLQTTDAANGFDASTVAVRLFGEALTETGGDADKIKQALGTLGLTVGEDLLPALIALEEQGAIGVTKMSDALREAFSPAQLGQISESVNQMEHLDEVIFDLEDNRGFEKLTKDQVGLIASLEQLQDTAENTNLDEIVRQTLLEAAASDEATAALVKQAEAQTGLSLSGENILPIYTRFLQLEGQMVAATATAGSGFDDFGRSVDTAGGKMNKFSGEMTKVVEPFDAAAAAANGFNNALDRIINRQLGVAGAQTNLASSMAGISEAFTAQAFTVEEAARAQERLAGGFDLSSAAGRENQTLVQGIAGDILSMAAAELEAGVALDDVKGRTLTRVDALKAELQAAGLTEEQVQSYIDTLGLTPTNIETAIKQTGAEQAEAEVADYQKKLDAIDDKEYVALVRAQTDEASVSAANRALDRLTEARYARIVLSVSGAPTGQRIFMAGGRVDLSTPMGHDGAFTPITVGEAGREIVWVPKGAEVLNNSTTERLLAAMGQVKSSGGGQRSSAPTVTRIHPQDLERMAAMLADMMPPLATLNVPYVDTDALASKVAARWAARRGY